MPRIKYTVTCLFLQQIQIQWHVCLIRNFSSLYFDPMQVKYRGVQISQKCISRLKNLGARRLTCSKLHKGDPQLGIIVQNVVVTETWRSGFVHKSNKNSAALGSRLSVMLASVRQGTVFATFLTSARSSTTLTRGLRSFPRSLRANSGIVPRLGRFRFLPNLFQCMIYPSTQYTLSHSVVINT